MARELNAGPLFVPKRRFHRIALISPWAGGNLGNTAILAAAIANISRRVAGAEIWGITLNPEATVRRFGIQAFPLAALSRPGYTLCAPAGTGSRPAQNRSGGLKQRLRRIPLARWLWRCARTGWKEVAHIARAAGLLRGLDCVMIAGGGALDATWGGPWGHPWSLLKWSLLSRLFRVPFLVVSVGKSPLERPLSRRFIRTALRLSAYRSYRDHNSKEEVQRLIAAGDDPVQPDLAFSYPAPVNPPAVEESWRGRRLVIGVSPIAYCDPRVWPVRDAQRYGAYVRRFSDIVKWLLKEGHQILFFATDSPDLETINDVRALIADAATDANAIRTLPDPTEQLVDNHLQAIGGADLVVASRLHGVILSHLCATPALAISYDPKVDAHMSQMEQMDYCLSVDRLELKTFVGTFTALRDARSCEATRLLSALQRFRRELALQYDMIFGVTPSSRRTEDQPVRDSAVPAAADSPFKK